MKYFLLLVLFCFSCTDKKAEENSATTETPEVVSNEPEEAPEEKITDKFDLESIPDGDFPNEIKIVNTRNVIDKDSITTAFYRIDFYKSGKKVDSHPMEIEFLDTKGEWYISQNLGENDTDKADKRFLTIGNGFAACGYSHKKALFYLSENGAQLIQTWDSAMDSGFGNYMDFIPKFSNGKVTSFVSRSVEASPEDAITENGDGNVLVSYADSTYNFIENNQWKKKLLTPKGKIYREEKITEKKYFEVK